MKNLLGICSWPFLARSNPFPWALGESFQYHILAWLYSTCQMIWHFLLSLQASFGTSTAFISMPISPCQVTGTIVSVVLRHSTWQCLANWAHSLSCRLLEGPRHAFDIEAQWPIRGLPLRFLGRLADIRFCLHEVKDGRQHRLYFMDWVSKCMCVLLIPSRLNCSFIDLDIRYPQ